MGDLIEYQNEAFPEFIPAVSVIETSFNNIGAVFHPAITILNLSRIESTLGNFQFYIEGVTQSVAKIMEVVDRERLMVAKKLKCANIYSAIKWLSMAYNVVEDNLFDAIHSNPGYVGIMAPRTTNIRYITEDIPMSLVPSLMGFYCEYYYFFNRAHGYSPIFLLIIMCGTNAPHLKKNK